MIPSDHMSIFLPYFFFVTTYLKKIHLDIVIFNPQWTVNYLWGHPIRGSHHRLAFFIALDICAKPKICHFNCSIHAKQNIVRFDVSMNNTLVNNKRKTFKSFGWKQDLHHLLCYVSKLFQEELRGRQQLSVLLWAPFLLRHQLMALLQEAPLPPTAFQSFNHWRSNIISTFRLHKGSLRRNTHQENWLDLDEWYRASRKFHSESFRA